MGRGTSRANGGVTMQNVSASVAYAQASKKYPIDYESYARGQISKTDAGQLYKAVKNSDVDAKPELVKDLYNGADASIKLASQRYTQDHQYYDNVTRLTHSLLNKDYKTAQKIINEIENDNINRATRKSPWYKYKKGGK